MRSTEGFSASRIPHGNLPELTRNTPRDGKGRATKRRGLRSRLKKKTVRLQNKLARKQQAQRQLADGQKIIIGGMMLALAQHDDAVRKRLVELLEKHVTRDADLRRIKPLIAELKNPTAAKSTEKNTPPPSEHKPPAAASVQ